MLYPDKLLNTIIRKNNIKTVIEQYTADKLRWEKGENGGFYSGKCPLHPTRTFTLLVDTVTQTYQCFECGNGGNVVDFIMKVEHTDFEGAIKILANRVNIELPEPSYMREENSQSRITLNQINLAAARFYRNALKTRDNAGLKYFRERGLTDETIQRFGLGYAGAFGEQLYQHLLKQGFNRNDIMDSGLIGVRQNFRTNRQEPFDKFWDRAMFPILCPNVIGFGGRVLNGDKPKYLNSPETEVFEKRKTLYGYNYALESKKDYIILCEGYMDVISMHQAGFDTAVASLGTAFTEYQAKMIADKCKKVFLAYDSDTAGINAAMRAIPFLEDCGIAVKVLHFNPSKDPDEFIKNFGKAAMEDRLAEAESSDHFKVRAIRMQSDSEASFYDEASELLMKYLK